MRTYFLVFLYLLSSLLPAFGQTWKVYGLVKDAEGTALPFAQVIVQDSLGFRQPMAYALTDSEGKYLITVPLWKKVYISARYLGYQTDSTWLSPPLNAVAEYNFMLQARPQALSEVVVTKPMAAIVKGDTTIFKVDSYTRASDTNLEDVLKRMPGIKINKDGVIFFNGKRISKLMLDSDDVVGQNYQLLSQTIAPHMLENVEVIRNFQSNPLLRNIADSDETIINLTFKNNRPKIFGDSQLGGGNDARYLARLNSFLLSKKTKFLGVAGYNTIGQDPITGLRNTLTNQHRDPLSMQPKSLFFFNEQSPNNLEVPPEEIVDRPLWQNRSKIGSLNVLQKQSSKLSFRINTFGLQDTKNARLDRLTEYITPAGPLLSVLESEAFEQKPNRYYAEMLGSYMPSDKLKIDFLSVFNSFDIHSAQKLESNITPLNAMFKGKQLSLHQKIEVSRLIAKRGVLLAKAEYNHAQNQNTKRFFQNSFLSHPLLDSAQKVNQVKQQEKMSIEDVQLDLGYIWREGVNIWTLQVGTHYAFNSIKTSTLLNDSIQLVSMKNNVLYKQYSHFVSLDYNTSWRKWRLNGDLQGHIYSAEVQDEKIERWIPTVRLSASYKLSKDNNLLWSYNHQMQIPYIETLIPNYMQRSYRELDKGATAWHQAPENAITMSLNHNAFMRTGRTGYLRANYSQRRGLYLNTVNLVGAYTITQKEWYKLNQERWGGELFTAQKVAKLKSSISLVASWLVSNNYNLFNSAFRETQSNIWRSELTYQSLFKSGFNLEAGLEWKKIRNKIKTIDSFNPQNESLKAFLELVFETKKGYYFKPSISLFVNNTSNTQRASFTYADFVAGLPLKNKHWNIELRGVNLFNSPIFRQVYASDYIIGTTSYHLFQAYVLIALKCQF
ncbi:MAG: hypothetical protein EAZ57_00965 [Cytophagales bacterium]|nr:MAG: hypothetical protein EAZ67_00165 [Cytophagales bacterium]TAF62356.1 MAG: hypothetical protein EAZ57_00965 [Cytophagales bacterium]